MSNDKFYKWTKEIEERSKKCMIELNEENKIRRMLVEYSKNDLIDFIMRERNQIKHLNNIIDGLEKKMNINFVIFNERSNGKRITDYKQTEGAKLFRDYLKYQLKELKRGNLW